MHDPMVVAHDVCLPIPVRQWPSRQRWGIKRMRRSNEENLGEPVYPWWRPKGWEVSVAGTRIGLYRLATIWHNEPRGADALSICKHGGGWRWHVHHWSVQVHPWQAIRRWVFDRCRVCHRGFPYGYCPTTFSWDPPKRPWWAFWRSATHIMHSECASLVTAGNDKRLDKEIIRALVAECRVRSDESEPDALKRIYRSMEFGPAYRLMGIMGYEWDEAHENLVPKNKKEPT